MNGKVMPSVLMPKLLKVIYQYILSSPTDEQGKEGGGEKCETPHSLT